MANEGPTQVGSIDASVGMTLDRWRADVAQLKADAAEIGALRPTITADFDGGRAEASMAAVDAAAASMGVSATTAGQRVKASGDDVAAAQAKVAAANAAADTAYARAELAQQRLTEAQESGRTKASSLMAAEIALTEALSRLDSANTKATISEAALAEAQQSAARSAAEDAAAETENAAATKAAGDAAGYTNTRMLLIAGAVAAVALVAAPLTGTVVGLAGALGGLGAAGVLGIVGIVAAMKQATGVGQEYSAGLKELKGDLTSLGSTAAIGFLAGFQEAVAQVNGALPNLNSQIAFFSQQLGTAGNTALTGAINALHVLNPLFIQSTRYAQSLADGFASWTSNGGLQKFADYAQSTFPLVTRTLGDLVSGVVQLVEALAPVGLVLLNIIDVIGQFVGWLGSFGPALGVVAGAAAAAFAAFKLWEAVGPILSTVTTAAEAAAGGVTALGVAMDAASGPIGWVIAGVTALTAAVGISVVATQQNSEATSNYTSALQQSNGALDENIRKTVAKQLSDQGVLETAKQYHIELSRLTDAILGNATDQQYVNDQIQKYGTHLVEVHGYQGQVTNSYTTLTDKARSLSDAVNGQTSSLKDSVEAYKDQKSAAQESGDSMGTLTGQQQKFAAAQKLVTDDTNKLADALSALGQVNRDADQANIQYQQNLDDANQSIKENGRTLDETTEKGRANASALDDIASSGLALIAAQAKQGASEQTLEGQMGVTRQAFIDTATQMGATKDQASKLADQYGLIPSNVTTAFSTSGLGDAINQVNQLQNAIDVLMSGQHEIQLGGTVAGYYGFGHAAGGRVGRGHAAGGQVTGPGTSSSDTAGLYYPVSDREWIISNMQGQSSKWDSVLSDINANASAGQIAGKAMRIAGVQAPAAPQQPVVQHVHNWYVQSNNAEQLYQDFTRKTNAKVGP